MKKRKNFVCFCMIHCFGALLIGLSIYVLLRPDSYIHSLVARALDLTLPPPTPNVFADAVRYYLADALWAYALTFALVVFIEPVPAGVCGCLFGLLWEFAQWHGVVGGTFDLTDILMYLSASLLAVWIIKTKIRRTKSK